MFYRDILSSHFRLRVANPLGEEVSSKLVPGGKGSLKIVGSKLASQMRGDGFAVHCGGNLNVVGLVCVPVGCTFDLRGPRGHRDPSSRIKPLEVELEAKERMLRNPSAKEELKGTQPKESLPIGEDNICTGAALLLEALVRGFQEISTVGLPRASKVGG